MTEQERSNGLPADLPAAGDGMDRRPHEGRAEHRQPCATRRTVFETAFAAIDLGTNNCRMLIAGPGEDGLDIVDSFSRVVRLGEGLQATGRLSDEAMERTIGALRICSSKLRRRREDMELRAVATHACRKASNCCDFVFEVKSKTGIFLEIITPEEEGRLAMLGCAPLLDDSTPYAVIFDIGGGSSEVIWARLDAEGGMKLIDSISVPHGVVTLSEKYGSGDLPENLYCEIRQMILERLSPFDEKHGISEVVARGEAQMIGVSGTMTTIGGVFLDLPRYDRRRVDGMLIGFDAVLNVSRELGSMGWRRRAEHPCIGASRADLVMPGCAILEAICKAWPIGTLRVADRGLREGILLEMMRSHAGAS